ncbi:MAG: 23S rRNA (adenine(2030)-N(6))-methyltransferase RlmJ [Alphaproteobacteria bacterium]|nr:23S rRNA (adenine(2030)-N(6))-methyltransferase RlmJ [Alphaproteobacteria bacterium]
MSAPEAQKLGEYREGFLPFREKAAKAKTPPEDIKTYLRLIDDLNKKRKGFYPGSALIAAKLLGAQDSLTLCELHKGEIEFLKKALKPFSQARVLKEDGYAALARLLPPSQKHGGILIDPSYEVKTEYGQVLDSVQGALTAWPQGVYMVWYPILKAGHHRAMVDGFRTLGQERGVRVIVDEQLFRDPAAEGKGMAGTGMVIINPPARISS